MTVLHVVVAGDVGGAERVVLDLATAAGEPGAPRPHAIALVTPNPDLARFFARPGLAVWRGPAWREGPLATLRTSFGPRVVGWLAGVARQAGARLLHVHTFGSQVVGTRAARRLGLPCVRTEHSRRVYDDLSCWPLSRWSLARADAVVAISEHIRQLVVARAPWVAPRLAVVYNGVSLPPPAPAPPRTPFTFVVVARLEPRKGVDLALRALALVPGARLEVVGDGPRRPSLQRLAARLALTDRVLFHGRLDAPGPIIAAAGAVLVPSRSEGLSLVALEAHAHARPVVARPIGGLPEIVIPGVTGWLAANHGVAALATAMREAAAAGPAARALGEEGRRRIQRKFTRAAMAAAYEQIYHRLLPQYRPRCPPDHGHR